ncbi:AlbA family DNA-binding domain-containing protein [Candidatus Nitrosocosmicus agrestis]|jgi:hypothetical protein|uniref:AlbA family DNA-binding domain-containing protein n=1 Tax=Candidatus Nitrosocosmicus agrestis TaxID=2563600 RepID=UPI00122DE9C9|nr:ATP-binding protein [Candidatus Nitrosocosmicus sp. SS]KAA2282971.1 ATP-binding protein [Candidatus Nitrosocosmicus sp. SS]KAF0869174.1 ATP-binding protein [Candidatus Nitrosocosmicus sp. SS]
MIVPQKLEDWNLKVIEELVTAKINESDRHDFKLILPEAETLTKTCCAYANTNGGFIVLGIGQSNNEWKIVGINNHTELAHQFGQKLVNAEPSLPFNLPKIIKLPSSDKVIAIFHIPLSDERPHIPSVSDKRKFWKRTNKGNVEMTYQEIRMSFQRYEERREKIKLLHIELFLNLETLKGIREYYNNGIPDSNFYQFILDSTTITSLVSDLFSILGKDPGILRNLILIRKEISRMNLENELFNSRIILPQSNQRQIVIDHNIFINQTAAELIPHVEVTIQRIENQFQIKNPLLE